MALILIVIGLELVARRALSGSRGRAAAVLIVVLASLGAAAYVALGPAIPTGTQNLTLSVESGQ